MDILSLFVYIYCPFMPLVVFFLQNSRRSIEYFDRSSYHLIQHEIIFVKMPSIYFRQIVLTRISKPKKTQRRIPRNPKRTHRISREPEKLLEILRNSKRTEENQRNQSKLKRIDPFNLRHSNLTDTQLTHNSGDLLNKVGFQARLPSGRYRKRWKLA